MFSRMGVYVFISDIYLGFCLVEQVLIFGYPPLKRAKLMRYDQCKFLSMFSLSILLPGYYFCKWAG